MVNIFFLVFLGCCGSLFSTQSWYHGGLEGWYYFDEREASAQELPQVSLEEAELIVRSDRKRLEQLLSLALVAPSPDNVSLYMGAQKKWLDQSARFAAEWGKILLENPLIGEFITHPTTSYGILVKKESDLNKRKSLLNHLASDHFLLFFFQGGDPFSQKAAEVVQLFSQVNGWKVKAVSLDGKGVEGFPEFEVDRGISTAIGVRASPSLFVVNPFDNLAVPVGAGLVTVSDIEQNIELQFQKEASL